MTTAELHQVSLSLGRTQVLRDIDLRISAGDRLVLMGPSGAGKSSLLRVLAGLVPPTSGEVLMEGQPVRKIAPASRDIALLSQDYALYPQLSVRKNLQVGLDHRLLSKAECKERVECIAAQFEIAEILECLPSQISGGQAQRAALAKAVVRSPKLLLLDEPLSQLDSRLREQLIRLILSASYQLGIGLCWVVHQPWEAFRIATRIGVMDCGQLIQHGVPEEVYQFPRNRLVADLLSSLPINWLLPASPEFEFLYNKAPRPNAIAGIRPEALERVTDNKSTHSDHATCTPDADCLAFTVEIEETCFFGQTRLAWGKRGSHRILTRDPSGILKPGMIARLSVQIKHIIWADS